jgi:hypothetical protein
MEGLELEEISKTQLKRKNAFYGRRRVLKFLVANKEVWLTLVPQVIEEQVWSLWSLDVRGKTLQIYLSSFPDLSDLEPRFQEVNWQILPPKLQLLFWEAAWSPLFQAMESLLGDKTSLLSMEKDVHVTEEVVGAGAIGFQIFVPSASESFIGYWQTKDAALDESLQNLWKRQVPWPLRTYHDLRMDYTLELGATELTREDYEKLQEEDIILLDRYFEEPGTISPLRGFEPFQINVVPCREGFRVHKIQF